MTGFECPSCGESDLSVEYYNCGMSASVIEVDRNGGVTEDPETIEINSKSARHRRFYCSHCGYQLRGATGATIQTTEELVDWLTERHLDNDIRIVVV